MSKLDNIQYKNRTESSLIKSGAGAVYGIIVNSHTNGTLQLDDATAVGSVAAVGTLTSSGAAAPAVYAQNTLTSDATNVTDADTCTIGTTVYQFKDTPAAAYDVQIGASAAATLDNLKAAINASGTAGTEYYAGTLVHPEVIATTNTDTTQVVVSRTIGDAAATAAINALATTEASTHLSWADSTLGGGTGASVTAVTTDAATIVIDTTTYTAVTGLAETHNLTAVPYQVLWVTSEAVFLDNLKSAINDSGTEGTDYATGTAEHPTVEATTNTNTAQTVQARSTGAAGNLIATTETVANYVWGAATLASGAGVTGRTLINTFTFAAGSGIYELPQGVSFVNGLYATIGGAIDYTILYD